jgi:hypothetical protein
MPFLSLHYVLVLSGSIFLLSPGKRTESEGYRSVIRYEDEFIAAGSNGRIDRISLSGKIMRSEIFPGLNFNCVISDNKTVIAAGDNGTILISSDDGLFRKVDSGTGENINSLTLFNTIIIAGADRGEIISGDTGGVFGKTNLPVKGNIVSVSARRSDCYGVTDEGEIIHSADAINWDILDFNQLYSGFYQPCYFIRVLATDDRIAVAGIRNDGSPVLMFSSQGKVWTERKLSYTDDHGMSGFLSDSPGDIFYDSSDDQFFLACRKGKLMKLTSCSQCNELAVITDNDLTGVAGDENTLIIVGSDFFIKAVNLK